MVFLLRRISFLDDCVRIVWDSSKRTAQPFFDAIMSRFTLHQLHAMTPNNAPNARELAWHRIHRMTQELNEDLLQFALSQYVPRALEEAWFAFHLHEDDAPPFAPD